MSNIPNKVGHAVLLEILEQLGEDELLALPDSLNATALGRAAIEAMREPSIGMANAGLLSFMREVDEQIEFMEERRDIPPMEIAALVTRSSAEFRDVYKAMIDEALEQKEVGK